MLGDVAAQKETLKFDAIVLCPECNGQAEIRVSRKQGNGKIECGDCGIVRNGVIQYGAGLIIGDMGDD
jgi:transcription elongation factor Elf1